MSRWCLSGVNQGMLYGMNTRPRDELRRLLDASAAVGFKWLWPLVDNIGGVNLQAGGPFDNATRLVAVVENVTFIRDHRALLGYYVCDGAVVWASQAPSFPQFPSENVLYYAHFRPFAKTGLGQT